MFLGSGTTTYRKSMMFANDPGAVLVHLLFSVVDAFGLTVLVFFRRNFGERVLTFFKYGCGISILAVLLGLKALAAVVVGALPLLFGLFGLPPMLAFAARMMIPPPHHVFVLFDGARLLFNAFVVVGGIQLGLTMQRSYFLGDGVPIHSRSFGESIFTFRNRVSPWIAMLVLEPLATLMLGRVLVACDPTLPMSYFVVLALFLEASALHQFRLYRDDLLDARDQQIVAGFYEARIPTPGGRSGLMPRLRALLQHFVAARPQAPALADYARQHRAAGDKQLVLPVVDKEEPPPPAA